MSFALVMYFDQRSEVPIREIWQQIADANLTSTLPDSGVRPHMTLSVFDEIQCLSCEEELKTFANETKLLSLEASHIGIFTYPQPVVFLAPTPTLELIAFHRRIIHSIILDVASTRAMYHPGSWVPHCTLALDFEIELLSDIAKISTDLPLPFKLRATQVGVVEFQPIKPLFDFDLMNE